MRKFLLLTAFIVASVSAQAQVKPDNTVRLTYDQVQRVLPGLAAIGGDGYPGEPTKDGGVTKQTTIPWQFSPNVRVQIAKDINLIRDAADTYLKAKRGLIKQYLNITDFPPSGTPEAAKLMADPNYTKLDEDVRKLGEQDSGVDYYTFTQADLSIEKNAGLQGLILSNISPLIVWDKK